MSERIVLDLSGAALEAATALLAEGGKRAAAFGRALDRVPVAAFALGFATPPAQAKDRTVLASFLLAATRRSKVIVSVDPARQHPVNLARTVSTLGALHGGRIGVGVRADAATGGWFARGEGAGRALAADYLRLVSSLWDSWPLDAVIGDARAGHYVDARRIVRIADPVYADIGGPLTLPTDGAAKPPLVLVDAARGGGGGLPGIDVALCRVPQAGGSAYLGAGVRLLLGELDLERVLAWQAPPGVVAGFAEVSLRDALGLGPSRQVGCASEPVFGDPANAAKV